MSRHVSQQPGVVRLFYQEWAWRTGLGIWNKQKCMGYKKTIQKEQACCPVKRGKLTTTTDRSCQQWVINMQHAYIPALTFPTWLWHLICSSTNKIKVVNNSKTTWMGTVIALENHCPHESRATNASSIAQCRQRRQFMSGYPTLQEATHEQHGLQVVDRVDTSWPPLEWCACKECRDGWGDLLSMGAWAAHKGASLPVCRSESEPLAVWEWRTPEQVMQYVAQVPIAFSKM